MLLEKKSRRIELALYVMQKVVDALLSLSAIRVRIPAPNIVFASLALMSWSHCNFSYEDALRKSYRSAFRKLFDGRELHSMSSPEAAHVAMMEVKMIKLLLPRVISFTYTHINTYIHTYIILRSEVVTCFFRTCQA